MVSGLESNDRGSGSVKRSVPPFTYAEKFEELFPMYLAIGMTYEQYWEQDCALVKAFRKAHYLKQEMLNQQAWLQGAYFYDALLDVAPLLRPFSKARARAYRKEPFDLKGDGTNMERERIKEAQADNKAKSQMEMMMVAWNKQFEKKGGGVNG